MGLTLAGLCTGCSHPAATTAGAETGPAASEPASSQVATVDLDAPLSGRLSLRIHRPSDGASNGGSLLFELQGSQRQGQLLLQTPIGTTLARVQWDPEGAEVVTAQGRRRGMTLDEVSQTLLGESLPMAALLRWLRAEPWSGAPHQPLADGFEQLGWRVSLNGWHENVITAHRPPRPDRPQDTDILVRARLDAKPGQTPP